jgi:hypothetical protein
MNFKYLWFMNAIYTRGALVAIPVYLLAVWLSRTVLPGRRWIDLIAVGVILSLVYYSAAFIWCIPDEHRCLLKEWVARKLHAWRYSAQPG